MYNLYLLQRTTAKVVTPRQVLNFLVAFALFIAALPAQLSAQTAPTIRYISSVGIGINQTLSPQIIPTSTNVAAIGYSDWVNVGTSLGAHNAKTVTDSLGNVYAVSTNNSTVKKFPAGGGATVDLGGPFTSPSCIAIDWAGNLYVGDQTKVYKIAAGSTSSTELSTGYGSITALAVDNLGFLYINDGEGIRTISKVPVNGGAAVLTSKDEFALDIAADHDGNIYVVDNLFIITRKVAGSNSGRSLANDMPAYDINVDASGIVYVMRTNGIITKIDRFGVQQDILNVPNLTGGSVSGNGDIYISTSDSEFIQVAHPTGGYFIDKALPTGLTFNNNTGSITGLPNKISPATTYLITAYNGTEKATANITVLTAVGNANLSGLTISSGTLSPAFRANARAYSAMVTAETASINITPTALEALSKVTYNNQTYASGSPINVALNPGDNIIPLLVTTASGVTRTYTITVYRASLPTVSYGSSATFAVNRAINPVTPVSSNVEALGYGALNDTGNYVDQPVQKAVADSLGNIYAISYYGNATYKFPADGGTTVKLDWPNFPSSIVIDREGNLYIANENRVFKVAAGSTTATELSSGYGSISGLALDNKGFIYILDYYSATVKKVPVNGGAAVDVGSGFSNAYGLAVDNDGNVYVAETDDTQIFPIKKVSAADGTISVIATGEQASGLTIDASGYLYLTTTGYIVRMNLDGTNRQEFFSGFYFPGVSISGNGDMYAGGEFYSRVAHPTGGYFIDKALPAGLKFDSNTGTISGTPTELSPATTYLITAYNRVEKTNANLTIQVTSKDADLSDLAISSGTLSPVFSADITNYTALVSAATSSVDITPTVFEETATVTYGGQVYASGTPINVSLAAGNNSITLLVTAPSEITKTYTISITRESFLPPTLAYDGGPYAFQVGDAIGNITPTVTNAAAFGYGSHIAQFGAVMEGGKDVATDSHGNVYVVDIMGLITKYAPNGAVIDTINTYDNGAFAVALDADDNIYTANSIGSVTKIAAGTGVVTTLATTENYWYDIAVDKNGTVYVADISDNTVKKIPAAGGTPVVVGTGFDQAASIAVDATGDVYVSDLGNLKIKKIRMSTDGGIEDVLDNIYALSLTFDKANNLYFAESYTQQIRELPANGDSQKILASDLWNIYGIAVDNKGTLYGVGYFYETALAITPAGGYFIDKKLPLGLNFDQNTGTITGTPTKSSPAKTYNVTVYNGIENVTAGINISVTSANAKLSDLALSSGALSPVFAADTIGYTSTVSAATSSLLVTPTAADMDATIQISVNGGSLANVPSGVASSPLALNTGINTISVIVTAQDGTTKGTYTITATREAPLTGNVALSYVISPVSTLTRVTGPANYNYTTSVAANINSITITPKPGDVNAVVKVEGVVVSGGTTSAAIPLTGGTTTIHMDITAPGGATRTYAIAVNRDGSSNTKLSIIMSPASTLIRTTGPANVNYSTSVAPETSSIIITPKAADAAAVVRVEGNTVAYGASSAPITLLPGTTTVQMEITAPSGVTRTYAIAVSRNGSSNTRLSFVMSPASVFTKASGPANYNYSTSVAPETGSIIITPKAADPSAVVRVEGNIVANGASSAPLPLLPGTTTVQMEVTAPSGLTQTYAIAVSRNGSSNTRLSFVITPASTITKASGPANYNYTTSVAPETGSIIITPKAADPSAVVRVEGNIVANGASSAPLPLLPGITTVQMEVTAPSGLTQTYAIAVSRNGSSNTRLSFKISPASAITTTTGPANYNYSTSVAPETGSIIITPKAGDPAAVVRVEGNVVANGSSSVAIPLATGTTVISMNITAVDGSFKTYELVVSRPAMLVSRNLPTGKTDNLAVAENTDKWPSAETPKEDVVVHQALSPNGDGVNDVLTIDGIISHPDNQLSVINANGTLIYHTIAYGTKGNVFDGHSSNGTLQKPGTYYYILEYKDGSATIRKTGYIVIKY